MKILVRAPNWLGDGVLALPALKSLALSHREATITVVASRTVRELYEGTSGFKDLRTAPPTTFRGRTQGFIRLARELRRDHYDMGIALPGSFSSALLLYMARIPVRIGYSVEGRRILLTNPVSVDEGRGSHLSEQYMRLVVEAGGRGRNLKRLLSIPAADRRRGDRLLRDVGIKARDPFIAVAPGAAYGPAKRWPADRFGELGREMVARFDWPVVVLGSPSERYLGWMISSRGGDRVFDLTGQTSIRTLGAILSRAKLLVANDSGPMHVAAAVGTKVVALFGSTDPSWTAPLGEGHRIIHHDVSCAPCLRRTCHADCVCLTSIAVDEVLAQVKQSLLVLYQKMAKEPPAPHPLVPRARPPKKEERRGEPPFEVFSS